MDSETETRANRVNILILFFLSLGQSQDSWPEGYTKKWWHCLHLRCIQIVDIQNTMHCICMSTIWMKCHLPVKISMRYMLDEADYDAEKNKGKGCQGCWQQVKVDKSVHCVWSLNSQVLCAFGNVYFYNSLSSWREKMDVHSVTFHNKKDCCHSCNNRKTTLKAKYK